MWSFIIRAIISLSFCVIIVSWYLIPDSFFVEYSEESSEENKKDLAQKERVVIKEEKRKKEEKEKEEKKRSNEIKKTVKYSVPFVVQAPHAQWDEIDYQDACEEASMIMADGWVKNDRHISKNDAEKVMEEMFDQEEKIFNGAIDTSVTDTAKFFTEYYGHSAEVRKDVTMEDLYRILSDGYIIIVPTNGKMLGNPHFTNGGPERHMLVIIGYNKNNREFITNDPGTRVGRGYKYKDTTLYNAIRDYETGKKKEIIGTSKNIIIVKK
ncbi:MAG: hypothetical protein CR972_04335 [Candidatus Moraniibacteriota bacterium]|nr:MAG: hypothetical protein CR972_04335 [Candidatus Moranbacteria bacterium]